MGKGPFDPSLTPFHTSNRLVARGPQGAKKKPPSNVWREAIPKTDLFLNPERANLLLRYWSALMPYQLAQGRNEEEYASSGGGFRTDDTKVTFTFVFANSFSLNIALVYILM